jgi:hypothetical protein
MKLTIHLHPLPRSRMMELDLHFVVCLDGIMLHYKHRENSTQYFSLSDGKDLVGDPGVCGIHYQHESYMKL